MGSSYIDPPFVNGTNSIVSPYMLTRCWSWIILLSFLIMYYLGLPLIDEIRSSSSKFTLLVPSGDFKKTNRCVLSNFFPCSPSFYLIFLNCCSVILLLFSTLSCVLNYSSSILLDYFSASLSRSFLYLTVGHPPFLGFSGLNGLRSFNNDISFQSPLPLECLTWNPFILMISVSGYLLSMFFYGWCSRFWNGFHSLHFFLYLWGFFL